MLVKMERIVNHVSSGKMTTHRDLFAGHPFIASDDENDASDESGTEDPAVVSMDRNKTRAESERQKNRDRFLELEQGSSSSC